MGNKSTKEKDFGAGHPQRFYDGCAHVKEGEYATGEICFNQAMARHPGHAFWTSLMEVAIAKAAKPSDTAAATSAQRPPSAEGLPSVLKTETELGTTVFRDGDGAKAGESAVPDSKDAESPHPDANLSLNDPPSESKSAPTLLFPVDHRLVDLQDYVRMLTDIGRIYRRKAAESAGDSQEMSCRLSMLYNAYTTVRLQMLVTVMRAHLAAHSTEEDGRGEDMFQLYAKRSMSAQWASAAFKTEVERCKSTSADDGEVNMDPHHQSGKSDREGHPYDVDVCIFMESLQYYLSVNLLSYVLSALRMTRSAEYPLSPATQKAVLEMALRSFEVVERDIAHTAEANSHLYIGALLLKFIAVMTEYTEECRPLEVAATATTVHRFSQGRGSVKSAKDGEVTLLCLGSANLCTQQLTFLRTAMRFPVFSLPLVDATQVQTVKLEMQFIGSHFRPVKLSTPVDRSYGWYATVGMSRHFTQHAGTPGDSAFLLEKCGVPAGATMKDPTFFSCVGLEELGSMLFIVATARAMVLKAFNSMEHVQDLANATYQLCIDTCGHTTPISEAIKMLFENLDDSAA